MKKNVPRLLTFVVVLAAFISTALAQDDTGEQAFSPAALEYSANSYYLIGRTQIVNGQPQYFNKCDDGYDGADFSESGIQQDFAYGKAMIMADCYSKYDKAETGTSAARGWLGLGNAKIENGGTDTATYSHGGYIASPLIYDLDSIYLQTSADNVTLSTRHPTYQLHSTFDATPWDTAADINRFVRALNWDTVNSVVDYVQSHAGYSFMYKEGASVGSSAMATMRTASRMAPIRVRLLCVVNSADKQKYEGQRVFVHKLIIYAKLWTDESAVKSLTAASLGISVHSGAISVTSGNITVYSLLGRKVGYGKSVAVSPGLYIVRTDKGQAVKILVN